MTPRKMMVKRPREKTSGSFLSKGDNRLWASKQEGICKFCVIKAHAQKKDELLKNSRKPLILNTTSGFGRLYQTRAPTAIQQNNPRVLFTTDNG